VICDNVLLSAFAANQRPASRALVEDVARDFDLTRRGSAQAEDQSEMLARPIPAPEPPTVARESRPPAPAVKQDQTSRGAMFGQFSVRRRFSIF
jgi:hypothetical protein